ncbi:MAG: Lrp/AsnC family transcriptional regulator [Candidatus Caldatribacteriota bacterium]
MSKLSLDEIDLHILIMLQSDGRRKLSSIANEINLSLPSVIRRLQRMEDFGVIKKYTAEIETTKIMNCVHGILIGGVYKKSLNQFYEYIKKIDSIVRCETIICGGKEVFLEFYFPNTKELMDFYESNIRHYLDSMTVYLLDDTASVKKEIPLYIEINE